MEETSLDINNGFAIAKVPSETYATEYEVMPLADGNVHMCECENSSQTNYVLTFTQNVMTCGSDGSVSTASSDGTGKIPSTAWSASGDGASTDGSGNFTFKKNPNGTSRTAIQKVDYKHKDKQITGSLTFEQEPRKISAFTSDNKSFTATSVTLSYTITNNTTCSSQTITVSDNVRYDWTIQNHAYDTCRDAWDDKDCCICGTSAHTYTNTTAYTYTLCNPDSARTVTVSGLTYGTQYGTAKIDLTCDQCLRFSVNQSSFTISSCGGSVNPTITSTGSTAGRTITYKWTRISGSNTSINSTTSSSPTISQYNCNTSAEKSDKYRWEAIVNGSTYEQGEIEVKQSGYASGCYSTSLSTYSEYINACGGSFTVTAYVNDCGSDISNDFTYEWDKQWSSPACTLSSTTGRTVTVYFPCNTSSSDYNYINCTIKKSGVSSMSERVYAYQYGYCNQSYVSCLNTVSFDACGNNKDYTEVNLVGYSGCTTLSESNATVTWTNPSDDDWISMSGTGSFTQSFSCEENDTSSSRSSTWNWSVSVGSTTVDSGTITITQDAGPCSD